MGFWKDPKTRRWVYKFQYQGRQYGRRGFATKAEARADREIYRRQVKERTAQQIHRNTDFRHCASLYLDFASRQFAAKTYKYKAYVCKKFLDHTGDIDIREVASRHIVSYLLTRPSNYNYNFHRKDLSAFFSYARDTLQVIDRNPINSKNVPEMPHNPAAPRVPTKDEVVKILLTADRFQRAFILAVLLTQARVDEIQRLKWSDVKFARRVLVKWTRKRKGGAYEPVVVGMGKDLETVMRWLYSVRVQGTWVFYNSKTGTRFKNRRKMLKNLCRHCSIDPPYTYHHLRHFIASYLSEEKGMSLKTIQDLLGHKERRTTERYLHVLGEGKLQAALSLDGDFFVRLLEE